MSALDTPRYWSKVDRRGDAECWPWTAYVNPGGYGVFSKGRRFGMFLATHAALEIAGLPRVGKAHALHSCDNRACVNPKHLRWGDNRENIADRVARKRSNPGRSFGEQHGRSTTTDQTVHAMRAKYDPDVRGSIAAASREFGLSLSHAKDILRRKTWAHL